LNRVKKAGDESAGLFVYDAVILFMIRLVTS
jgi:hypothetical protein